MKFSYGERILRRILADYFLPAKGGKPNVSLRSFAKKIGVSSSTVSQFLSGQKRISRSLAEKIVAGLKINKADAMDLLTLFSQLSVGATSRRKRLEEYACVDEKDTSIYSQWHTGAIFALIDTKGFRSDPEWIARRLNLTVPMVESAVDAMVSAGILSKGEGGGLSIGSPDQFKRLQQSGLENVAKYSTDLLQRSLREDDEKSRRVVFTTLPVSKERLDEAYSMISEFHEKMQCLLQVGDKTAVYHLSVCLFPVSREL